VLSIKSGIRGLLDLFSCGSKATKWFKRLVAYAKCNRDSCEKQTRQVAARDEKWVPTQESVKISTTNVRLETIVPQKEETFQVIIDVIKNSTRYKAFTISAEIDYKQLKKDRHENMPYLRRVVKKKVKITADDNIVPEPDVALQLGRSMSLTKAAVEETARQIYATHARITSRRQLGTRGSSKGTGVSLGVLDESTVVPATSSEGTGTKPGDKEKVTSEANVLLKWGSKQESEYSKEENDDETIEWVDTNKEEENKDDDNDKSIDLEQIDDEETDDEFVHGEEHVQDNDEETDDEFVQGDEQVNDDDNEEMTNAKDITYAEINSLLDIKIQYEVPHIKYPSVLTVPILVISEPSVLTPIPETPLIAPATPLLPPLSVSTIPHELLQKTTPIISSPIITEALTITTIILEYDALNVVQLRVAKLEKDVYELKKIDHSKYSIKPAPEPSKIQTSTIDFKPESKKSALEIRKIKKEQAEKQKMLKYTIKSTNKATLKEYDQKSALYHLMNENKSFNRNPANHALYHAVMKSLIEDENAMDKGKIVNVVSVSVKKLHGYGHLEEIEVRRADRQVYKFKEGDFVDLYLNDIKDMLLLAVQHKLSQLDSSDIVDLIVTRHMFTRSLIIKRRVKDL
nr:hypothetical protein [Tanacetum cinerariifolium]